MKEKRLVGERKKIREKRRRKGRKVDMNKKNRLYLEIELFSILYHIISKHITLDIQFYFTFLKETVRLFKSVLLIKFTFFFFFIDGYVLRSYLVDK